ncbi:bifunctional riboflavin kinase/FAD synthetase [Nevskia soli]|jgi:riboflavin kinase/FMN adenylyltransferase|uniref:bifunctional riboflavin kinase/FAD synthetase n=1 Tax=Nevskia soli TaxID=418856 RepID=UPI001C5CBB1F|nr:bifunctional riboflavin kinase/FAD synthetase [Nevskia soli]
MSMPRVFWGFDHVPPDFGPCALTIGNFDGVHIGHQELMRRTAEIARAGGRKAAVLTFQPHPAKVIAPARAPKMICDFTRRAELMGAAGIEHVLVLPFTEELSRWTPEEFVVDLLVRKLGAKAIVMGDDFRFGHKQAGDRALLERLGREHGFDVVTVAPVEIRRQRVSSSLLREMAAAGRIARASRLLARPFELEGRVVSGHGIGSKQTVPTLNLAPDSEVLPRTGVYVTRTVELPEGRRWESITNLGVRPTFNGDALTIETYLLSPFEPPDPERIRVEFLWRIRDERKFASPEELKAQILRDARRAIQIHARLRRFC